MSSSVTVPTCAPEIGVRASDVSVQDERLVPSLAAEVATLRAVWPQISEDGLMKALRRVPEAGIASVLAHLPSDQIERTLSLLSSRRAAAVEIALSEMRRAAAAAMEDLPADATAPVETTAWQAGANVSARTAYRLVRSYVQRKIGQFLWADESSLRIGPPPLWAVPVVLIDPGVGRIGQVGQLHVDAVTGELMIEKGDVERIQRNARALSNAAAL